MNEVLSIVEFNQLLMRMGRAPLSESEFQSTVLDTMCSTDRGISCRGLMQWFHRELDVVGKVSGRWVSVLCPSQRWVEFALRNPVGEQKINAHCCRRRCLACWSNWAIIDALSASAAAPLWCLAIRSSCFVCRSWSTRLQG